MATTTTTDTSGVNSPAHGAEDYADLGNALAKILARAMMDMEDMLPAQVVSYDRTSNTAIVQPLIKIVTTGNNYSRGEVGPIPVYAAGAGAFVINFPVKAGDLGWMKANDRDITGFESSLAEGVPPSYRTHSFNDSVFFPDIIKNFQNAISGEDGNMVIASTDGTIKISLGASQIRLLHPTKILVDAPTAEFTGDVIIDKTLTVTETATITGDSLTVGGVQVYEHNHISESAGTPTGPMQN